MTDINCLLAGLTRLLGPLLLLIFWHKKTGARILPAPVALVVCFPVFIVAGAIRSGFDHSDWIAFHIQQGLLYGIFEEGAKFLVLRYLLTSYDDRKDAVTYGIGHSAFEEFGAGMACFNLIGTGRAAADIFPVNLFSFIEGSAFCIAVTILIFYGIQMNKSKLMLPLAMLLHFISNFIGGALGQPYSAILDTLITAGICYAAYRCYKALETQSENQW
ncbi:Putative membrane peptidase family [Ruminococcus flavefaciens]|uniref:Putative membrane peptidase family n=1 Tax=Ruminococcus flavefaciens TaxID=1265 RepID=A0A1H6J9H1_RUMFL|nr:YhfC family glutamic-type intramembrane protease [Ruminococcus flavefaciens]SEH57360.1 Putative membrane peptidase family [Ruminococcus flavefaciens]